MGSLHPAIVHIPIGLLVVYSGMEVALLFFKSYKERLELGKYIILFVGVVGSFFALSSGESLEHVYNYNQSLVEIHSLFATATVWVYGALFVTFTLVKIEGNARLKKAAMKFVFVNKIFNFLISVSRVVTKQPLTIILAIVGGVLLAITGALGGAIAHGPDADPVVAFVYSLFF